MSDYVFTVGAAFHTGTAPKVSITLPEATTVMTVEVAASFVREITLQIQRLVPQPSKPTLVEGQSEVP